MGAVWNRAVGLHDLDNASGRPSPIHRPKSTRRCRELAQLCLEVIKIHRLG
jgi:hypothetical protein